MIGQAFFHYLIRKEKGVAGVSVIPKFDVVILDEIETILGLFPSSTMDGKRDNFVLLADICKASTWIFALDALLGSKTIGFFRDYGLLKSSIHYSILFNKFPMEETTYLIYTKNHFLCWLRELKRAVEKEGKERKRVAIVSDRKNALHVLFTDIQSHVTSIHGKNLYDPNEPNYRKSMLLTGASSDADKSTAVDCNFWSLLDFLALSPVVTVGNSDMSVWDEEFALFKGNVTAATAIQMCGRLRRIKSGRRHILVMDDPEGSFHVPRPSEQLIGTESKRKISKVYNKHEKLFEKEARYLLQEKVLIVEQGALKTVIPIKRPFQPLRNLMEVCKKEELEARDNFSGQFIRLLEYGSMAYEFYPGPDNYTKEYEAANKAALQRLRKASKYITDRKDPEDESTTVKGNLKCAESVINSAVERLTNFGAPLSNRDLIRESITHDEFLEFQKTHPTQKLVLRNRYRH